MPRKRIISEPCDCLDCRDLLPVSPTICSAIARQQPPPKCLIIYLSDCYESSKTLNPATCPTAQLPHMDKIVEQGCSGLLAVREVEGCAEEGRSSGPENLILRNLFGAIPVKDLKIWCQTCRKPEGKGSEDRGNSLRNLNCELATDSDQISAAAKAAGFTSIATLSEYYISQTEESAKKIAEKLGTEALLQRCREETAQGPALDTETEAGIDLLFICMPPSQLSSSQGSQPSSSGVCHDAVQERYAEELNALDNLLKELSLQPGFQEGVLIVLLMGIHCPAGDVLPLIPGGKPLKDLGVKGFDSVVRPQQSYEVAALDESCPNRQNAILCVQKLPYVIRKDALKALPRSLPLGLPLGNGCILAERLLPEIAYKLNAAPKYGA